jgi:translation elongation factor EF-1beta
MAGAWAHLPKIYKTVFGTPLFNLNEFEEGLKAFHEWCATLDAHLEDRHFLVGESISVADVYNVAALIIPFQTVLDASFREKHANVAEWFMRIVRLPSMVKVFGTIVPVHTALKPVDPKTAKPAEFVEKKVEEKKPAAPAKKDDDELDLFGSDDEDDAAAAEALKKKAAEAKAKKDKPKKVVIAKSLVLFEVKPYEAETKMADMAAEILKIELDGLWWKTEWKTEPIAYGVEKLIIGCTVEDEKVSVDDLQEKIEGLEDLVQSVEIIGFNKI